VPSGKPAYGPRVEKGANDEVVLSWMESDNDATYAIKLRAFTFDRQSGRVTNRQSDVRCEKCAADNHYRRYIATGVDGHNDRVK
jgi:hypothetical protein